MGFLVSRWVIAFWQIEWRSAIVFTVDCNEEICFLVSVFGLFLVLRVCECTAGNGALKRFKYYNPLLDRVSFSWC